MFKPQGAGQGQGVAFYCILKQVLNASNCVLMIGKQKALELLTGKMAKLIHKLVKVLITIYWLT